MRKSFIVIAIFMILLLAVPILLLLDPMTRSLAPLDNVKINELTNEINSGKEITGNYDFDFVIMDENAHVTYKSAQGLPDDLGRATTERYTIKTLETDGKITGYLLIRNDYESIWEKAYDKYRANFIACVIIEAVIIVAFLTWTYFFIIEPFEKMKRFATNISSGDLDTPLTMDRGNIFGAFTESFDIMRSELAEARQNEYEAQRSKAELVAQLSHDIKTPVASIKAMGELLEAKNTEADQKAKLHSIVSKADQIDVLVSDLFATTLTDLNNLDVSLSEQPSSALKNIIEDADHKDYADISELAPCIIECDLVRTTQVINNIINNSYKYADTTISVKSHIEDDLFVISFTDKGGGVSEDDLPMITKRFRRGSNAEGKQGAGLGLAIASELMEKMEGSLECSNVDGGFRVTLFFKLA